MAPKISVVIPTYDRPKELALCLEGFAKQSAAKEQFEVVVVDDGSSCDPTHLAARYRGVLDLTIERCPHRGVSEARNHAIDLARAPLLILGEDDLRPLPSMVQYCLDFHTRYPRQGDAALLYFVVDHSLNCNLLLHCLVDHVGMYFGFPERQGIWGYELFWGGAISCKRSIFQHARFDPAYSATEDTEVASRIAQRLDLRVHFERFPQATFIRDLELRQVLGREYRLGFFRHKRHSAEHHEQPSSHVWYERPEDFIIEDDARRRRIIEGIHIMEAELDGVNPRFAGGPAAEQLSLLYRMYAAAIGDAAARGWRDAAQGRSVNGSEHEFDVLDGNTRKEP